MDASNLSHLNCDDVDLIVEKKLQESLESRMFASGALRSMVKSILEQANNEKYLKLDADFRALSSKLAEYSVTMSRLQNYLAILDDQDKSSVARLHNGLSESRNPRTPTESHRGLLNVSREAFTPTNSARVHALETRPLARDSAWKRRLGRLLRHHNQSNAVGGDTLPPPFLASTLCDDVKPSLVPAKPLQLDGAAWELPKVCQKPVDNPSSPPKDAIDINMKQVQHEEEEADNAYDLKRSSTLEQRSFFRQDMVRNADMYKIEESVWEMIVVVGTGWVSRSGDLQLILAFMINFVIQFVLALIILETFSVTENMDIDLDGLEKWRVTAAHNYENVDLITQETLISRVCRYDTTLGTFTNYVFMLNDIDVYNAPLWPSSIGTMLCSIVVLIWVFTVVDDALSCVGFLHGILCVPRSRKTKFSSTADESISSEIEFSSISAGRLILVVSACCLRLGIAIIFLFVGCKWLAHTYDFASLLLNSVALAFVFKLDELCFDILVPVDVNTVQELLKPLPLIVKSMKMCPFCNSSDLTRIPLLLASLAFFVYVWIDHIHPRTEELIKAQDKLCGGKLDFAYGYDGRRKLLYTSPTTRSEARQLWPDGIPKEIPIIRDLTDDDNYLAVSGVAHMDGVEELRQGVEMEIRTFVFDYLDACEDSITNAEPYILPTVQRHNSNPNATTCDGLKSDCFQLDQLLLRMYCPVSCGATSPRSGLFLDSPPRGIPQSLCRATQSYQDELNAINCTDPSKAELAVLPGWNRGWTLMVDFWSARSTELRQACFKTVQSMFLSDGCDAVAQLPSLTCMDEDYKAFCDGEDDVLNIAHYCPVACGCINGTNRASACPPSCTR